MIATGKELTVLVGDGHALFRAGLRYLLADLAEQVRVIEAGSCEELRALAGDTPDLNLVLLDPCLPGLDEAGGLREVRRLLPDVPVVVISRREDPGEVRAAMEAGVRGYIPKSSTPQVLIHALALVLSGGKYLPPSVLDVHPSPQRRARVVVAGTGAPERLASLTRRQREVMSLLAEGKSNKEIAEALGLAAGTVKIHVSSIFKALNVRNRTQAVITVNGLIAGQRGAAERSG